MNKKQYKRLVLLLLFPLFAVGWWAAETEAFFKHHRMTMCEEFEAHFSCTSIQVGQKERDRFFVSTGGVFLPGGTLLSNGFKARVVTTGVAEFEFRDEVLHQKRIKGAGVEKELNITRHAGANYSGNGPCTLSQYADDKEKWHLSCVGGQDEGFKFIDIKTNEKFLKLVETADLENSRLSSTLRRAYIISFAIPITMFLLISGTFYLLMQAVSFVRYGSKRVL